MEQFTEPVEGQNDGQETAATLGGLQVSDCAGSARRQQDDLPTDQGAQFTADAFTACLLAADIQVSMDGRGRALDNVFCERLWRSVKYEKHQSQPV